MKPKPKRRGRPSRAEASAKALADVDLTAIDPRRVLIMIAADPSSPATARVAACRALLNLAETNAGKPTATDDDPVTALALKLLRSKK